MQITFVDPLSRAWSRMKKALFQPFNLGKWFTLGFTAFLAALLDGGGEGNGSNFGEIYQGDNLDEVLDSIANFPDVAMHWMHQHPILTGMIVFGVVFLFILSIVLTWLSSRGKFMFLDNVVHNRAEVSKPWYEYKREGNSLFVWRLIFGLISLGLFIIFAIAAFTSMRDMYFEGDSIGQIIFSLIGIILAFSLAVLLIFLINLFLDDFVVPIMYKDRISASQAWRKFLKVLSENIIYFIIYALFIILLSIAVGISIVLFSVFTLLIGLVLLIIPYIGSVVFLPVSFTFRAFSVEFLEQFGEEFQIFPKGPVTSVPPQEHQ